MSGRLGHRVFGRGWGGGRTESPVTLGNWRADQNEYVFSHFPATELDFGGLTLRCCFPLCQLYLFIFVPDVMEIQLKIE